MRRPHPRLGLVLPLLLAAFPSLSWAQEGPSSAARLQKVIGDVVTRDGTEFIGLGSWMSGKEYRDPLKTVPPSDHDIRLVLPKWLQNPPPDPALHKQWEQAVMQRWKASRDALVAGIRGEFGADAEKILRRTNLYAPVQVMRLVDDEEAARAFFTRAGQVPRLDFDGPVTKDTPREFVEGLYGKGTEAYTQKYEAKAGRVFYKAGDKCYMGRPDLVHLAEMEGKQLKFTGYNVAGQAHIMEGWAGHCDDALEAGNGKDVGKYLKRLEEDMAKGRDLARAPQNPALRDELKRVGQLLRDSPEALNAERETVRRLLLQARAEARILARYAYATALQRKVMDMVLQGGTALAKAVQNVLAQGGEAALEHIGAVLTVGIMAYETTQAYDNRDPVAGWIATCPSFAAFLAEHPELASFGTAVLMEMTKAVIEGSRDLGYAMTAGQQNAFDLLAGIYSGRGRADVGQGEYTIDRLVEMIRTEEGLRSFVWARSQQAANRSLGEAGWVHDLGSAQAIFDRCYPVILRAWRAKREQLQLELQYLCDRMATERCVLTYAPAPAALPEGGGEVVVTVAYRDGEEGGASAFEMSGGPWPPWNQQYSDMPSMLARAKEIIKRLAEPGSQIFGNVYNRWSEGGLDAAENPTQRYRFTQPGTYTITLVQEIRVGATNQAYGSLLDRKDIRREMSVDVVVEGKEKPAGGVWKLVTQQVSDNGITGRFVETETGVEIIATTADGKLQQHSRCTWTPLPKTMIPGQELVVTLTAEILEWAGKNEPWMKATTYIYWEKPQDPTHPFERVETAMDTKPVAREFRLKIPEGRGKQRLLVELRGSAGFDSSRYFTYEYQGP